MYNLTPAEETSIGLNLSGLHHHRNTLNIRALQGKNVKSVEAPTTRCTKLLEADQACDFLTLKVSNVIGERCPQKNGGQPANHVP
jgi:hypothetical protein